MDDYSSTLVLNLNTMIFNDMNILGGSAVVSQVIVTITGRNTTLQYDGQAHSISNYNVVISDPEYTIEDFTFSGTASASGTNVGTYSMGLSVEQFENINPKYRNVIFQVTDGFIRITGKYVTVTADAKSKVYDNDPSTDPTLTATVVGLVGSDTITYSLSRAQGQNVLYDNSNTVVGYIITPTGETIQGNYIVSYTTGKFTINPAPVTLTAHSAIWTYDGSVKSASGFDCSVSDIVFNGVSAAGSGTDAGIYTVEFNGVTVGVTTDTTRNYIVTELITGVLLINKASASALGLTVTGYSGVYDGLAHIVSASVTITSGTVFKYSTDNISWSETNPQFTNAGTYTVYVKAENSNYDTATSTGTIAISKADASLLGLVVTDFSGGYDGTPKTITATVSVTSGTDITYSTDGSTWSSYSPTRTELGTTTVYVRAENDNYNTAISTGTITVNKGAAEDLGLVVTSYTGPYDGSAHTITATTVVTTGTVIKYSTNGTTWSATKPTRTEMGTTTVYVKAENSNYDTATATGTITIGKRAASELGLTVTSYNGVYDRNYHTITATVIVTSGTTIRYSTDGTTWSSNRPTRTDVGTTTVYIRAENSQYETATATGTITITKAPAENLGLTVTSYNGWYDGSAHTISASVSISSGTTIEYSTNNSSWSTTKPTRTAVGTTTVYVRAVNNNYNTATATGTITITERPTTGTITFTIQNNPGYVEIKDYNTDETIVYRYFGVNTYSITGVPPGTYLSTNEEAGTYTLKSVSAGYTVDVTGFNW